MKLQQIHPWDLSIKEAIQIQSELSKLVIPEDILKKPIRSIAGVDASYDKHENICSAAVVVINLPSLEIVEYVKSSVKVKFPYIPGLLSFREAPAIAEALSRIKNTPDIIFCDGQGIAHPRRFGIACHIGLITDLPTIGVAKSLLIGDCDEPCDERGSFTYLRHKDEIIGAALRTRVGVKPIYVSIGHKISLQTAIQATLECNKGYRLPEPTRLADKLAAKQI
ncbi:MAG: deoxyribonuclease V [Acidobacteria bacterium]|nr:MAG: deoxyribonuclease V [Acidobacteriota bacterium]